MMRPALLLLTTVCLCLAQADVKSDVKQAPWEIWLPSNENSSVSVDHSDWQRFLDSFVVSNPDGINRVAYAEARAAGEASSLERYLQLMADIDPRKLSRNEQFPYWVNLYNALTISVVLQNPEKSSIRRMGRRFFSVGPWDDELITIAGIPLTLNDIEHRILRPIWQDRRIHYAVNCASLGCPNLDQRAYTSRTFEQQLSKAEHEYLNHPRGVKVVDDGRLHLSSLFNWYQEDFAASEDALILYLAGHNQSLANVSASPRSEIRYSYDWSLNGHDYQRPLADD